MLNLNCTWNPGGGFGFWWFSNSNTENPSAAVKPTPFSKDKYLNLINPHLNVLV